MATFQPPSSLCANLGDPSDLLGDLARLGGPNNLLAHWAWLMEGLWIVHPPNIYIYIIYISKISKIIHVHNIYIWLGDHFGRPCFKHVYFSITSSYIYRM